MYLHIGKDMVINTSNLIAIFDISVLERKKNMQDIIKELDIDNNIIDVSEGNRKTFIITQEEVAKCYISNISSITLAKRAQEQNKNT